MESSLLKFPTKNPNTHIYTYIHTYIHRQRNQALEEKLLTSIESPSKSAEMWKQKPSNQRQHDIEQLKDAEGTFGKKERIFQH